MQERVPCEFFLVRYVPDVVKGEFVNIGVLLREAGAAHAGPASAGRGEGRDQPRFQVRFTRDWSRVRCMDADADVGLLEGLEQEIAGRLRTGVSARDPKAVLEVLEDTLSNSVQMTEARAALAESLPAELEQLMRMYVEPIKVPRARAAARSGRAAIQGSMRTEFERAGVWGLMRKRISAAMYTRAGDPMRLDCGYRVGGSGIASGVAAGAASGTAAGAALAETARPRATPDAIIRIFQAVSLEGDLEAAKVLAYSAPQLVEGVRRVESGRLELTAVVESIRSLEGQEEAVERYRFGVETMERQEIRVVTVNDLARAAATAQRELGL